MKIIFAHYFNSQKYKKKSIANDVNKKDAENKFYASFISYLVCLSKKIIP